MLDLDLFSDHCTDAALGLILPHAQRIRSIFVDNLSPYKEPHWMLRPLLDVVLPALEVLELTPVHAFKESTSLLVRLARPNTPLLSTAALVAAHWRTRYTPWLLVGGRQCERVAYPVDTAAPAGAAVVGAAFWTAVLEAFSSVEHLCIIDLPFGPPELRTDLLEFLRALQPARLASKDVADFAEARCSLLTRLSVHGQFGQDAGKSLDALEILAECVDARARAAARLEKLDVHFRWHRNRNERPLGDARRSLLAQARRSVPVGRLVCKIGSSAGCRACRWRVGWDLLREFIQYVPSLGPLLELIIQHI
ncbi:hypothetical protein VTO73DRAFT_10694 [Trametes versicolor]